MKKSNQEIIFKKLVEHMNEGVWVGDKNERTVYANPKFCTMVGYNLKEMLGRKSYDFWDKESAQKVRDVNENERKRGISSSYEGNLVSKNGKKIPVLCSGTPLHDGGTIGIHTDLTELKKKQETEKLLTSAIYYATDAILVIDKAGKIQLWNIGAKMIFGYETGEIKGQPIDEILSPADTQLIAHNTEILYNVELQGIHKNKSPITISATVTPIFSDNRDGVSFNLLIGRDITHENKIQEELALKYQKLKEAYNQFGVIRRQMDFLVELLDLFDGTHDKKTIADFIVTSIIMLTRVDGCVLRIFNQNKNTLDLVSCFGVDEGWKGKASIKYKGSLVEKAFQKKTPLKIIDVGKEPRYQSAYLAKRTHLSSLLLIPLTFKSKLVGSLSLYVSTGKKMEIFENEFIEKYAKLIQVVVGTMFKVLSFSNF